MEVVGVQKEKSRAWRVFGKDVVERDFRWTGIKRGKIRDVAVASRGRRARETAGDGGE